MDNLKIAFLSSCRFDDSAAIRGAILVTDADTKPLEFRVTEPVRPTTFQKTLYGELLDEHILIELIAVPLLNALKEKPGFVLVRESLFLGINAKQRTPAVLMLKDDEPQSGKNAATEQLNAPADSSSPPLILKTSESFKTQLANIRQQLQPIYSRRNLLEPFSRIATACNQVHAQKPGE